MIEATELTKSFGAVRAVRGISFRVEKGEAVGFLGPNGAGKSTTFRMVAGTLGPTSGRILLHGVDLAEHPLDAKRGVGYAPENAPLYPELTTEEYLLYRSELKGIAKKERKAAIQRAAEQTEVRDALKTRIAHLSKGYRQRVTLADALLGDPSLLLLDEPTSGLDPNQVLSVRRLIKSLAKDHAILLSTHILSEVEATCNRAIVLHEGRVAGEGTLAELQERRTKRRAHMLVRGPRDTLERCLTTSLGNRSVEVRARGVHGLTEVRFALQKPEELAQAICQCCAANLEVFEAGPERAALDDVFAQLTGSERQEETE